MAYYILIWLTFAAVNEFDCGDACQFTNMIADPVAPLVYCI